MTSWVKWLGGLLPGLAVASALAGGPEATRAPARDLHVLVPSAAGSNTDLVTRGLAERMANSDGVATVAISNVPGNGGLAGLLSFLDEGSRAELLVTSLNMVDSALLKRAPTSVDRLTPIARIAAEPYALVVGADSAFTTLDELRQALLADPSKLAWAGGPTGSADHVATVLLGRALGVETSALNYVAFLATADAVAAAGDGKVMAAFVPIAETTAGIEASKLKLLAIASEAPLTELPYPTLRDSGVDLVFSNWRGIVARGNISAETRTALVRQVGRAAQSPEWQALVSSKNWQPAYLPGDDFARFILAEQARLELILPLIGGPRRPGE